MTLALLLAISSALHAQEKATQQANLIKNASFEEYIECPQKVDSWGQLTTVVDWTQPTGGSADYYNVCGGRECRIPKNKLGEQPTHSGNGYCGIYCSKDEHREYLQTRLEQPLEANAAYKLTFYVSLSEYSSGSIATIGGLFTNEPVGDTARSVLMKREIVNIAPRITQQIATYYTPQVVNSPNHPLTDTRKWQCVSGIFVAKGGEQYLTIGNFNPADNSGYTDLDSLSYLLPGAYYYIDDVSLKCIDCGRPDIAIETGIPQQEKIIDTAIADTTLPTLAVGNTIILKNIFFDFDKSTLLQKSYNELSHLIELLNQYPNMIIEIRGHTDGRGTDEYNQVLSESRAKAVVNYLIQQGIDSKRLQFHGYGKSMPIMTNDTEEGRSMNRRVEFKILEM